MFVLTGGFFAAELITAMVTGSLAMMGDAMHMLSDFIALLVGFYSIQFAKKSSSKSMTYGYARAEVIGALFNGTGILAICFSIFIEAVHRTFFSRDIEIKNLKLLLWVAVSG